jgi:hypothetical protein
MWNGLHFVYQGILAWYPEDNRHTTDTICSVNENNEQFKYDLFLIPATPGPKYYWLLV